MRSHAKATSAIVAICCGVTLALGVSPALAAKTVVSSVGTATPTSGASGFQGARFNTPRGVALNTSGNGGVPAGTFYVVDSANNRIQRFAPNGSFVSAWGWGALDSSAEFQTCKVAANCKAGISGGGAGQLSAPQGIAVDQASGVLYVANQGNRRIEAYSATGAFLGAFGWKVKVAGEAEELQLCTSASGCQVGSTGAKGGQLAAAVGNLVVAPEGSPNAGSLYVADKTNRRVDELKPTLSGGFLTSVSFVRAFGWNVESGGVTTFEVCTVAANCLAGATGSGLGQFGNLSPADLGIDAAGNVYALDPASKRVQKFDLAPAPVPAPAFDASAALTAAFEAGNLHALAVDPISARLFVAGSRPLLANRVAVAELDAAGAAIEVHGADLAPSATNGLSVAPASLGGDILLTAAANNVLHGAYLLGEPPAVNTPTDVTAHSATLNGTLASNGVEARYRFEYSEEGSVWSPLPVPDATVPASPGTVPVSAPTGDVLRGSTQYHVRLVVTRPAGGFAITSSRIQFTTAPSAPTVTTEGSSEVGDTVATLEGHVNAENQPTAYRFQYVSEAEFQSSGYATAAEAPSGGIEIGASNEGLPVSVKVSGLQPSTTYRFRLIASNATGTTEGQEMTLTTFSPAANDLPDGRAYEQATPVDKNGTSPQFDLNSVRASSEGNAITFFAGSGFPGGEGAQVLSPSFLASRAEADWSTQGLLPPASTGHESGRVLGLTEDLSYVISQNRKDFGQPLIVYLRDSADGALSEIAGGANPPLGASAPEFAGASAGGEQVLFESIGGLLPGAVAGKSNVYLWDRSTGALRLASAFNDGQSPPQGAFAGPYAWFNGGAPTEGGSAREHYTQDGRAISLDGSRVFFTAGGTGQLYLRVNPTEEQSPLDLQGECEDPTKACTIHLSESKRTTPDPNGPFPAAFMAATPDGDRAFFTSKEELTDDANTGPAPAAPPIAAIGRAGIGGGTPDLEHIAASARGIALDATHVYWADPEADCIGRAELDGGNAVSCLIGGADNPQYVALSASHVYWTNASTAADGAGSIGRATLDLGTVEQGFITGLSNPQGIAVNATHIYWASAGSGLAASRRICRANLDGSSPCTSFINPGGTTGGRGVALNATHVYWANPGLNAIGRANLDTTGLSGSFIAGAGNPQGLALDGTHVFWANAGTDAIGRAELGGGGANQSFLSGVSNSVSDLIGLAVNGAHLYWANWFQKSVNPGNELYRYDAGAEELLAVSSDPGSANGAEVQGVLGISEDGSTAYFVANGALAPGATAGDCERTGTSSFDLTGECNLYVWRSGAPRFVARLRVDGVGGIEPKSSDAANWTPTTSTVPPRSYNTSRVSADGDALLFRSRNDLTGYDSDGHPQYYRYTYGEDRLICVSCIPTGAPPTGFPSLQTFGLFAIQGPNVAAFKQRNLSLDGDRVFFESPEALVAGDVNGALDVYEWEAPGAGSCPVDRADGCLFLISTGRSTSPSYFGDASSSGDDVFIFTLESLVAQDGDQLFDVYDARVGGGIASQNATTPAPCGGESCRGTPIAAPTALSPGSGGSTGSANSKPCRRGEKRARPPRKGKRRRGERARAKSRTSGREGRKTRPPKRKGRGC